MKEYTIEEINNFLETAPYNKREWFLEKNYPEVLEFIYSRTNFLDDNVPISERLYCIEHDINSRVLCKHCHINPVKFHHRKNGTGYNTYCSCGCMIHADEIFEKRKQTSLEKYGVENPAKSKIIKEKIRTIFREKYGCDSVLCLPEIIKKAKQTKKEKYGDENYNNRQKTKQTCLEKFGFENPSKALAVREKLRNKIIKKYKEDHDSYVNKIKKTLKERYGFESTAKSPEILIKVRTTRARNLYRKLKTNSFVELLTPENDFIEMTLKDIKSSYEWKCKKCGSIFHGKIDHNMKFYTKIPVRCHTCFPIISNDSIQEKTLKNFIKDVYSGTIVENDKTIIKPKELDVYLPELKLAIEYDGTYWHSEKKGKFRNYHLNKTIKCEKQGIHLIHIFEKDWLNNKDKTKNFLLSYLDGTKLLSNCLIKEISFEDANIFSSQFLVLNEMNQTNKFYGLFDKDVLVAVLEISEDSEVSFSIKNFFWKYARDDCFEKFMKFFELNFLVDMTMTVDRMFFEESFLEKYDFECIGKTSPRKQKFDRRLGFYDCGTLSFLKKAN